MEQLTLFGSTVARRPIIRKKHSKIEAQRAGQADLWSQEAERERFMALLFLDIRNFTPLAEKYEPGRVIHMIQKLFSSFQRIIRVYHGQVIETTGDGLYAAFGFGETSTGAAESAVAAGHAIFTVLNAMNGNTTGERIQVGIGIHAGKVATGNIRIHSRMHHIVMGHAVNVASRIQSATKELNNDFIVSRDVFDLLPHSNVNTTRCRTRLKGLREEYELYLIGNPYD